jgi:hypothetical protein
MRAAVRIALVVGLAGLAGACSKAPDKADPAAKAATPRDAVIAAWTAGKLAPSKLAPAQVAFAKDCQSGAVEGVEVLLCSFATPAEAKAAEDAGLSWVGAATGASQAHGAVLIVVADRKKADPNGKTINQLMKLAPN